MNVKETKCKSILNKSKLSDIDYTVNPYTGCSHSCIYCYATFMKRFTNHSEKWGEFVDVKINAPQILRKEIKNKKSGNVLMSTVTDPYQPVEDKYEISRKILKILSKTNMNVSILTKNKLVQRDLDIIKDFDFGKVSVGMTINYVDDKHREIWEPKASTIEERMSTLSKFHESNIPTYIHIGPYFEGITDIERILNEYEDIIYELEIENLNTTDSKKIMKTIKQNYPDLKEKYSKILNDPKKYKNRLRSEVNKLRKKSEIPIHLYID